MKNDSNSAKSIPISTVGRQRNYSLNDVEIACNSIRIDDILLECGDSLTKYAQWEAPTVIISDGGYGILGFQGDTSSHLTLPDWYEPHIKEWSKYALPSTTLWFWNSEIGWAAVHPVLEKYGWEYVNCNIWNKGLGHIAGNVNTAKIRRFPVVTEVCVQYTFKPKINGRTLQHWLIDEWKRTGLAFRYANDACGVKNVASRKYFDAGHLWYFPPPEMFEKIVEYANKYGADEGKPYFSKDGISPMTFDEWSLMRYKFHCPHGYTNVWERSALRGNERVKSPVGETQAAHLNQKPLDLIKLIIEESSDPNDVIWEPFGGLFTSALAARQLGRRAYASEIDPVYFSMAKARFID